MVQTYQEAIKYIENFISEKLTGELGLRRMKYFLSLLGNPQDKYPTIHVAGTSGKGSTSFLIANILKHAGYKTGLHVSPHLETTRERMQINGVLIDRDTFVLLLNKIIPIIDKISNSEFSKPTYYEILLALTFLYFAENKIDIGVIETGLGGTFDGTNVLRSKISVITPIGFDHTNILGDTLIQIAENKAGIIKKGQLAVISARQKEEAEKVLNEKALKEEVSFFEEGKDFEINIEKINEKGVSFGYKDKEVSFENVYCSLLGIHQGYNASLAIRTIRELEKSGFGIGEQAIRNGLGNAIFPGRLDVRKINGKVVILDGAHNEDKMAALIMSLRKIWKDKKITCIVAFKNNKDVATMAKLFANEMNRIIITKFYSFTDTGKYESKEQEEVINLIKNASFKGEIEIADSLKEALPKAFNKTKEDELILITGSLYLVGEALRLLKS